MSFLTAILLLVIASRLLGQLAIRLGQPAIVGELLAGVLLGPSVLGVVHPNAALSAIAELAVFLIVLAAGLEMRFTEVMGILRGRGLLAAALGFVIPLASGIGIGIAFSLDVMRTIFIGLCIAITALPVAIRILDGFKMLSSRIAKVSIATAVLNDIAALLALGVIIRLPREDHTVRTVSISILETSAKLMLLGAFVLGVNALLQRAQRSGVRLARIPEIVIRVFGPEALFGIVVAFALAFGSVSEALGFHFVIGAFFGALLIDKDFFLASRYRDLEITLHSLSDGFLAPIFFAYLGLEFSLASSSSLGFIALVLAVSIGSKILAGWLGGRLLGMPGPEALGLGIILNGRGVMELVVASIALQRGFIGQGLFSTLVLMGVVTTIMTPLLFRRLVMPKLAMADAAPTGVGHSRSTT